MARITDVKCKLCRRSGEKLFLKGDRCNSPKCAFVRKSYAPGMHGNTRGKSKGRASGGSEFGKQLAMKQKIKHIYGVLETQLRKHYSEIENKKGVVGDMLVQRLEMRLDNVVYRLGLGDSRAQARQLVNHGLIKVNGRKLSIASAAVRVGDAVKVSETKLNKNYFKNRDQIMKNKKDYPSWLSFDANTMEGKVLAVPTVSDLGSGIDPQMVVEYYSR